MCETGIDVRIVIKLASTSSRRDLGCHSEDSARASRNINRSACSVGRLVARWVGRLI